ncbi:MAG: DUF1489 domain-containing protein [Pseudomonadota bacterium]
MTVHIIKLSVGCESLEHLAEFQSARLRHQKAAGAGSRLFHATRMVPKRQDEVLDGGSIYWVIRGVIQARQRVVGFEDGTRADGTTCCLIMLHRDLVPVRPTPRRPFQGWRYLKPEDAPEDFGKAGDDVARMPAEMRRNLADLGLL